ncbi:unnamed protein product [Scytosiphon promiscuus]
MGSKGRRRAGRACGMKLVSALAVCLAARPGESARIIEVSSVKDSGNADSQSSLQAAMNAATPGDTILLAPGMYYEDVKSFRHGKLDAPITIKGPRSAVVRGKTGMNVVSISHHHVHLEGFSIDGSGLGQEDFDELDPDMYHRSLLNIRGDRGVQMVSYDGHEHRSSGVTGFRGTRLNLSHARCTCIMLSGFVTHAELRDNDISDCGISSTGCGAGDGGGGGESGRIGQGLELGTPGAKLLAMFDGEVDGTAWNAVVGNSFSHVGGACGVVHQGAHFNLLDGNTCMGSRDADGAGFVLLGDANTFQNNYVTGGSGAGLAVGGSSSDPEEHPYGVFNEVHHNQLQTNEGGALRDGFLPQPSGKVCENGVDESGPESLAKPCGSSEDNGEVVSDATTTPLNNDAGNQPYAAKFATEDEATSELRGGGGYGGAECRYVAIPPEHVVPCEQSDVRDQAGATGTHWSRNGQNECLEFTLTKRSVVGPLTVTAVEITFNNVGAEQITHFEVSADGEKVIEDGRSSGGVDSTAGTVTRVFTFPAGGVAPKKLRYTELGIT